MTRGASRGKSIIPSEESFFKGERLYGDEFEGEDREVVRG